MEPYLQLLLAYSCNIEVKESIYFNPTSSLSHTGNSSISIYSIKRKYTHPPLITVSSIATSLLLWLIYTSKIAYPIFNDLYSQIQITHLPK